MSLLNSLKRLYALWGMCVFLLDLSSRISCLRVLRALLTRLIHTSCAPYSLALGALFEHLKIFLRWIIFFFYLFNIECKQAAIEKLNDTYIALTEKEHLARL